MRRLEHYLGCTKEALERQDLVDALAHLAEVSEISRRLWSEIQSIISNSAAAGP
jgi:hypothetical protein